METSTGTYIRIRKKDKDKKKYNFVKLTRRIKEKPQNPILTQITIPTHHLSEGRKNRIGNGNNNIVNLILTATTTSTSVEIYDIRIRPIIQLTT
jgi:hypothetical protein